ncbi:MAG TPA: lactate utilization protein [Anaerolineae bacterium]|nr:lactate utilization protein [Anaerolineae bacterium]
MSSSRHKILSNLRSHQQPASLPPKWQSSQPTTDLIDRYRTTLAQSKGESHLFPHLNSALGHLTSLLTTLNPQTIVYNHEPPLTTIPWPDRYPNYHWHNPLNHNRAQWRTLCSQADIGLTSADAALAATGSLVLTSAPGRSRFVSLLPATHIVLLPTNRLTPDIFTWQASHDGHYPANTILISGPSKTADIEQTLVVGAHGPTRLIVLLYQS